MGHAINHCHCISRNSLNALYIIFYFSLGQLSQLQYLSAGENYLSFLPEVIKDDFELDFTQNKSWSDSDSLYKSISTLRK